MRAACGCTLRERCREARTLRAAVDRAPAGTMAHTRALHRAANHMAAVRMEIDYLRDTLPTPAERRDRVRRVERTAAKLRTWSGVRVTVRRDASGAIR